MIVGAMIVGAMIVGALIVGTMIVGAMIVGAMRRPRAYIVDGEPTLAQHRIKTRMYSVVIYYAIVGNYR